MKLKALAGLALMTALGGCASFGGDLPIPDGLERHEVIFCQHYGNLYANIAKGREMGLDQDVLTDMVAEGVEKARMPEAMRPTMREWAPVAVYRVYAAPDMLSQGDWRTYVETECMDNVLKLKNGEIKSTAPKVDFIEWEKNESRKTRN